MTRYAGRDERRLRTEFSADLSNGCYLFNRTASEVFTQWCSTLLRECCTRVSTIVQVRIQP